MTVQELHTAFKIGCDKIDSLNYVNFETVEIDHFLNQAQDRVVKQRYGLNNIKRQSFEESQKRIEDLKELVTTSTIVPTANSASNIDTNAVYVTLPTDHWFIIQERVDLTYPDCRGNVTTSKVRVVPIQHNDFDIIINDPFKKPNEDKVLRLMSDGKVELIHASNHVINNYILRYLKEPQRIDYTNSISCELSEHIHQEVVDNAIDIAIEASEGKRLATFKSTLNTNE